MARGVRHSRIASVVAAGMILSTVAVWAVARAAPAPTCRSWDYTTSPSIGTDGSYLNGVAATSTCDAWAVGYWEDGPGEDQTLAIHWNGTHWFVKPTPDVGGGPNSLSAVATLSRTNAWAVGYYFNESSGAENTLTMHWNGSSWSVKSSPNVGTGDNELNAVRATSPTDVWAVGYYLNESTDFKSTLIEHWNGTSWSVKHSPNVGMGDNVLNGVRSTSPTNAWAVGYQRSAVVKKTLIEHWNGSSWSVKPSPNVGPNDNVLNGVRVTSASDAWAVGFYHTGTGDETLIEHWNGSSWSVKSSPNGGQNNYLNAIGGASSNDIWAVGYYGNGSVDYSLIEHWNGTLWSVISSPSLGTSSILGAVAATSSNNIWAVGSYYTPDAGYDQTLVQHCC